jgi:hypothetical protein
VNVCSTSHAATGSARDRQPTALLKVKKQNGPLEGPIFASQPASRYAERPARYPTGAHGLEQDRPFQGSSFRRPVTKVYVVVTVNIDIPQYKHAWEYTNVIDSFITIL